MSRSVMWFRRDLRIDDQPALAEACSAGEVLPLFVDDPRFDVAGEPRRALLHDALTALQMATEGALVVRRGDPIEVIPAVASEVDAATVYVTKDFGPYGRRRDADVADALRAADRRLRGVGSNYAVEPGTVTKADGGAYSVYTPFSKRWSDIGWEQPQPAPRDPQWIGAATDDLPDKPAIELETGVAGGWRRRWEHFAATALDDYAALRNRPAADGTSRLSPLLRFGVVHPRQLLAELDLRDPDHRTFQKELAWRDFYADVLHHRPETAWNNLNRAFDAFQVDSDAAARRRFERWCQGTTGFPLVDAGMRQLSAIGWMHNRVRMVTASFLVKDLHLPWQWGARHFMGRLGDGDLASNNHGWQWTAGCGTDAAPFFRVFNPTAQQEKFDPDGEYVRQWIPELDSGDYPAPMVDHAAERTEALARYAGVSTR
jgi:deoxyribodipyrimidine photo-lyase